MTSSPRKALAPAERSSERGEMPSPHTSDRSGVYLPPYLLGKLVPVTSAFPGPSEASEPLGAPSFTGLTYPELSSPSAKRPASQTELRSSKSRRDSPSSRSSYIPTSSTGAQFTPASLHNEPKRASRKRLPGRPRKNSFHPADLVKPTGTRVDEDGDSRMCVTSPHHTTVLNDVHERFPFINAFQVPVALELRPTGPAHSHGHTGASIPNNPSLVAPSPSFSPREIRDLHSFTGRRSAYQPPRLSPSNSSITSTPRSPTEPLRSSSSSDALYGLPGIPIPLPPYPILPAPAALASQQYPVQPSVEADGYIIIRNAISPVLIRDVLTSIDKGLPVFARWDTAQTYATPIQAFKVRDEFVLKWRPALQPFYDSMRKSIPKMPSKSVIGSFTESDPRDIRHSLIHVGNANELYVHIALTPLSPETGFFHILAGSHRTKHPARTPVDDWSQTRIVLQEGDALIWRGDLHYLLSSKGGGYWQSLTFDWGSGVVDLTESPRES